MDYNKITISGRVSKPAVNSTNKNGQPMTKFSIACNSLNKQDTLFFICLVYGNYGINVSKFLKVGASLICDGRLKTFTTKEGGTILMIDVNNINVLYSKGSTEQKPYTKPQREEDVYDINPAEVEDELPF